MNDHPTWEQFAKAHKNIREDIRVRGHSAGEITLARQDGLQEALDELEDAFRHAHVAGDDGDTCARCGLDLRNGIHERVK